MRGMHGAKWQIALPQQLFMIPCASDLLITQDDRNQGLLAEMIKAALSDLTTRNCAYALNLSAALITHLNLLAMGWRSTGFLQRAIWKREKQSILTPLWNGIKTRSFSVSVARRYRWYAHRTGFSLYGKKVVFSIASTA